MDRTDVTTVARRFYALIGAGRLEEAVGLASPEFVGHGVGGPADLRAELELWAAAFPDLDIDVEDTITEGDRVAVRMWLRGTHCGTFAGVPASGRAFAVRGTDVVRIADGRVAEAWPLCDLAGLLVQVGVPLITCPDTTGIRMGRLPRALPRTRAHAGRSRPVEAPGREGTGS